MRSIFLRRLLIALILALILASVFMIAGYVFLSRETYASIKLDEMAPKAEAASQLVEELRMGTISRDAYNRLSAKLTEAAGAATVIFDEDGNVTEVNNLLFDCTACTVEEQFGDLIDMVLKGQTIRRSSDTILNIDGVLTAGAPVLDADGSVAGGVLLMKDMSEIRVTTQRLSTTLFWIIAVVVPVILLISTLNMRRMTNPLHAMSEAAIEMSRGNFSRRVDEDEPGETGVLARALNNLCETLSNTIYQLRSEKSQLDQLLQSLTDGVAATDGLGVLTHYNRALMRMFGAVNVSSREGLISDDMIWKSFDQVYASGSPQTVKYQAPGGKTIWITISPVVTVEGERTGVVGLFKDMTELERTEAMRREYVSNVSHELRTPLTALRGLLEPLSEGMVKDEGDRMEYYGIMLHEVMRMSRLIADMLMLSRLQAGTEYMEVSRTDINELLGDVARSYCRTAEQKGISLVIDAPDVPDALTDPDRIEQVLVILIDNAMRYTPAGGSITIAVRDGAKKLRLTVTDTGCGIAEEELEHIFDRFYKVDKSHNEEGTGLGLSIAKSIMDKLGEELTVSSIVGEGTCFCLTVQKYVRNAIALGPADESMPQAESGESAESANADADDGERDVVDAPYEVIATPPDAPQKKHVWKRGE